MTRPQINFETAAGGLRARTVAGIAQIPAAAWDACAVPDAATFNPFVTHAFLKALEDAKTVGGHSGWIPRHVVIEDGADSVVAVAPCYVKVHSQGEYIFDYAWADAYQRAGGRYYPKLQVAVPFTPVPGPRLLVRPGPAQAAVEGALAGVLIELATKLGLSSLHLTFLDGTTAERLSSQGFLTRTGQQFHWHNQGYATFEEFLATFASRKRKGVRKEREQALAGGIEIELITGAEITEAHWDAI